MGRGNSRGKQKLSRGSTHNGRASNSNSMDMGDGTSISNVNIRVGMDSDGSPIRKTEQVRRLNTNKSSTPKVSTPKSSTPSTTSTPTNSNAPRSKSDAIRLSGLNSSSILGTHDYGRYYDIEFDDGIGNGVQTMRIYKDDGEAVIL